MDLRTRSTAKWATLLFASLIWIMTTGCGAGNGAGAGQTAGAGALGGGQGSFPVQSPPFFNPGNRYGGVQGGATGQWAAAVEAMRRAREAMFARERDLRRTIFEVNRRRQVGDERLRSWFEQQLARIRAEQASRPPEPTPGAPILGQNPGFAIDRKQSAIRGRVDHLNAVIQELEAWLKVREPEATSLAKKVEATKAERMKWPPASPEGQAVEVRFQQASAGLEEIRGAVHHIQITRDRLVSFRDGSQAALTEAARKEGAQLDPRGLEEGRTEGRRLAEPLLKTRKVIYEGLLHMLQGPAPSGTAGVAHEVRRQFRKVMVDQLATWHSTHGVGATSAS